MSLNLCKNLLFGILFFATACASADLMVGKDLSPIKVDQLAQQVNKGDIVILGEMHGQAEHQKAQLEVLEALRNSGKLVSVGMEFFAYPYQEKIDLYRKNQMPEAEFLKAVQWGHTDFKFYRNQVQFPDANYGEFVKGLNIPRSITGVIAKSGLEGLSDDEKKLLPPLLEKGNPGYYERFKESMSGHIVEQEKVDRYFMAQSVWDDTMAWQACEAIKAKPEQVLVIIVGEFHVQYGGGLPNRLKAHGCPQVKTVSLVDVTDFSEEKARKEVEPSPVYGPRADWVWSIRAQD